MEAKIYRELLADLNVTKCQGELDYQCKTTDNKLSVGVYFNCHGLCDLEDKTRITRVILMVYPGFTPELVNCHDVDYEHVFMVFSQNPLKAYTYKLMIDSDSESANIRVHHFPEVDSHLICKEEIAGLTRSVLPSHRTFRSF